MSIVCLQIRQFNLIYLYYIVSKGCREERNKYMANPEVHVFPYVICLNCLDFLDLILEQTNKVTITFIYFDSFLKHGNNKIS